MFKTRHVIPGSAPATLTPIDPAQASKPVLKLTEYNNEEIREQTIASVDDFPPAADDGKVRWIEMDGLGDADALRALGEKYDLHPLAIEDVWHVGQRPKIDVYEKYLFIIVQMIYRDEVGRLCAEQVSMFLGENLLITIQEEPHADVFDPLRARLRTSPGRNVRKLGADYLAYSLLDAIIDHCFPVLEVIGDTLEEIEDEMLVTPHAGAVQRVHDLKRSLMQLRRFVWPQRDVVSALLHDESGLICPTTKIFLRDCYDHTVQTMDLLESYRDISQGLMELYLSSVSMRTNETMRVLTVISSIFIPLTFVAGVYGMNFDYSEGAMPLNMPELHHPWGYVTCVAVMLAIAIAQLVFFRRKGWL
jgi:magnesium transporter